MLAYTVFMTAFFQALFAAALGTVYALIVILVLVGFSLAGWLYLPWANALLVVPLLFLATLAFATLGLLFTALVPSIDPINIPFFLVIMPLGFASSTYTVS